MLNEEITAKCSKCGEVKSLSLFTKVNNRERKYRSTCHTCDAKKMRDYLDRKFKDPIYKKEFYRNKNRNRKSNTNKNRKSQYPQQKYGDKTDAQKRKILNTVVIWHKNNKEKIYAHWKVRDAIKSGKLIKPKNCVRCNESKKLIDGHHTDYTKPLDVLWLCRKCHIQEHHDMKLKRS